MSNRFSKTDLTKRKAEGAAAEPALMDVRAVAHLLDCSARHIYRLADAGKMPRPRHIGALVRWSRSEILSWIDDGCPAVRSVKEGK